MQRGRLQAPAGEARKQSGNCRFVTYCLCQSFKSPSAAVRALHRYLHFADWESIKWEITCYLSHSVTQWCSGISVWVKSTAHQAFHRALYSAVLQVTATKIKSLTGCRLYFQITPLRNNELNVRWNWNIIGRYLPNNFCIIMIHSMYQDIS